MSVEIIPFSLKNTPALIEKIFPVQKLSVESYKEQMAGSGKTLTALGSYWKGRKPLILNKACILGSLLPATDNLEKDIEIFEKLMAMDDMSIMKRLENKSKVEKRKIEEIGLDKFTYKELVEKSERAENCEEVHSHIWTDVNNHLNTNAFTFSELVEQLGIMRFGHRPKVADVFCGSGQIPFEAARLGCDVYASDLNPIACMLTWGAFNVVGSNKEDSKKLQNDQKELVNKVKKEIDTLGVERDDNGWRAKVFLYCVEVTCPHTGWSVPLLPTLIISKGYKVIARLIPDKINKRYHIEVISRVSDEELKKAEVGTVRKIGKDTSLIHKVDGKEYKTKISTLRGDYKGVKGENKNKLRLWENKDIIPRKEDIFRERLYAIQWIKEDGKASEFRAVNEKDIEREEIVYKYVLENLSEWQEEGFIPDMKIEHGDETTRLYNERGWTYWHHLFNPRQLLLGALINKYSYSKLKFGLNQVLNNNSKLSVWHIGGGGGGMTIGTFQNQALNTLYNYGCRGSGYAASFLQQKYKNYSINENSNCEIYCQASESLNQINDIYITDPPYGDAVKYEEILEFFIAWLRKNPPKEFENWIWDSRRSLAIKGEDENFRIGMVNAYKNITEHMSDNGLQVIMFTHQSGSIWADMANIVWASGLQVTAAWYVVTETDSALRNGSYVKGTVLLVLRKRSKKLSTTRDDLAWDIKDEVEEQVKELVGLTQDTKGKYRNENLFEDADLQMAGYAAALRILTKYSIIDGKDMTKEAIRPRINKEKTFVDELIDYAVNVANQCIVPSKIDKKCWDRLLPIERFYIKMLELEARGAKGLDNYQNFAKAYKVSNFKVAMANEKANSARLKSAVELGKTEMSEESQFSKGILRGVLYAIYELVNDKDSDEVLKHLRLNIENFYDNSIWKAICELTTYLAVNLETVNKDEASAARILKELVMK